MSLRPALILLLALAVSLTGCAPTMLKDKQLSLERAHNAYSTTARWGNLADLYAFLEPELALQSEIPASLENIRVTQFETISGPVMFGDQATVTVRISYVHQDRQVVRSVTDQQQWRHDPALGWRRSNPIPEMP
jgi:hypothetical protein